MSVDVGAVEGVGLCETPHTFVSRGGTGGGRKKFAFWGHFETAIASCVFICGGRDRG